MRDRRRLLLGGVIALAAVTLGAFLVLEPTWLIEEWHLRRVKSEDPRTRLLARDALVRLGSVRAAPRFLASGEAGNPNDASAARDIIARLDERGMSRLAGRLRKEIDVLYVRAIEARKEANAPPGPLAVFLRAALRHPNASLRRYAAEELSRLGPEAACAAQELAAASKDESEDVRFWAELALESIGTAPGK